MTTPKATEAAKPSREEIVQELLFAFTARLNWCTANNRHEHFDRALDALIATRLLIEKYGPGVGPQMAGAAETSPSPGLSAEDEEAMLKRKPIFSGDESQGMWDDINQAKTIADLRSALYGVCCHLQELESRVEQYGPSRSSTAERGPYKAEGAGSSPAGTIPPPGLSPEDEEATWIINDALRGSLFEIRHLLPKRERLELTLNKAIAALAHVRRRLERP